MRGSLKRSAEFLLASRPACQLARQVRNGQCLILAYHNITKGPVDTGDRSLHLPFDQFRRQMDALSGQLVVPLRRVLDPSEEGRPTIVLTFDDASAGAITLALPELRARGYPVTVFVAPGILGQAAMWWDLLAGPGGEVQTEIRSRCLDELGGDHIRIMTMARQMGWPVAEIRDHFRIATEAELDAAVTNETVSLGVHSWSHPNLAATSEPTLSRELAQPLEWLQARWPRNTIPQLAFPYGIPTIYPSTVSRSGLGSGLMASGGWHSAAEAAPDSLPRLTVPSGLSLAGFRARVSGLWPIR